MNKVCASFLPTTRQEMDEKGWKEIDVLLVSGDAYVDHPSFGVACLGRGLEALGLKVGIASQPDVLEPAKGLASLREMGRPRLFIGISSGTVDSMINNYTANRKTRSDDMYSEGGRGGKRPDYASVVYSKLARQAFPDTPIIAGGVEPSLRRLAHYDYWQNRIRPSILLDLEVDFVVFGMGERPSRILMEQLGRLQGPVSRQDPGTQAAFEKLRQQRGFAYLTTREQARTLEPRLTLPGFEEVRDDKKKFAKAAYLTEFEASPFNGKRLVQYHGSKAVVVNPPSLPLSTAELDAIYELPFTKKQHPRYKERIPAADMIRFSVTGTRGCFGGCSFCAITLHQGRVVQSRSKESILKELGALPKLEEFKGIVTDIGGPTANMYGLKCKGPEIQSKCRKLSCVYPKVCPHLQSDHAPQIELLRQARKVPGIRKVFIASGLRYDLALADQKSGRAYLRELIAHHVGGHLKVAPEHLDFEVLKLMKKPGPELFEELADIFEKESAAAGKEQFLVPYFISGFPGSTHEKMEKIFGYMKARGWKLQQVQGFIPTPMTLATAMYWSAMDPATREPLFVAKEWKDKKIQQALLQPHKVHNREVLRQYRFHSKPSAKPRSGK
ncbi:MAG TPA: YgiQ family radical SAM protein [Bdellovibrionales bacterium]|nr:MAG: YgiQ family radical SAM protein [Bdellovibrionales bacterium GWA1_52_35]OFZ38143.1 MAG: YgiQ family radical SAM protein [Bdellovibrionales bacterium GWC1_52_8]HAR43239.1 YgiQ family radical SAM protein [Bdellovibrionales bacterium]HCM41511.1 YgiQ family radical SAM protein [Bdellovibrionales bacterium]